MSNEAINWAFKLELPMNEKFVLVALADYADENHSCYPSYGRTADRVGCHRATVIRLVKKLISRGLITVEERSRPNSSTTSNRYVLAVGATPQSQSATPGGSHDATGVVADRDPGGSTSATPPSSTGATPLTQEKNPEMNPQGNLLVAPEGAPPKKGQGQRLPEGWMPPREDIDRMRQTCPGVDLRFEHERFTDYWIAQPGAKGRKSNWAATWRNWIRKAHENTRNTHRSTTDDRVQDGLDLAEKYRRMEAGDALQIPSGPSAR